MASRRSRRLALFNDAVHELLEGIGIGVPVVMPLPAHVLKRHEIGKGTAKAFAEFVIDKGALEILMNEGKLVKPKLQVAPFPNRISVVGIFEDFEKLRIREAKAQEFAVDVVDFHERFSLALPRAIFSLACGATHLDGHKQQSGK